MILIAWENNLINSQIKYYFWIILQWWLVWWGVAIVRAELTPQRDVSQLTKKGVIIIIISTTTIIIIIGTTIVVITAIIITTVWSNRRCELVGFDDMKCTKHPAVVAKYVKVKLYFVPNFPQSFTLCSRWILFKLDLSKLLHEFLWVVRWICQN